MTLWFLLLPKTSWSILNVVEMLVLNKWGVSVCRFVVSLVGLMNFVSICVAGTKDDDVVYNNKINGFVFFKTLFMEQEHKLYFFHNARICASENISDKIVIVIIKTINNCFNVVFYGDRRFNSYQGVYNLLDIKNICSDISILFRCSKLNL